MIEKIKKTKEKNARIVEACREKTGVALSRIKDYIDVVDEKKILYEEKIK